MSWTSIRSNPPGAREQSGVRPVLDSSFSLDQLADAFRYRARGAHFGKAPRARTRSSFSSDDEVAITADHVINYRVIFAICIAAMETPPVPSTKTPAVRSRTRFPHSGTWRAAPAA
jgi:hypothetical protein